MAVTAEVSVTLQVKVTVGSWNESSSFDSIREASIKEAKSKLSTRLGVQSDCQIVGKPTAISVNMIGEPS